VSPEATYLVQSLGTIVVFGGVLYIATRALRRVAGEPRPGPLEVLARKPLDGRRAIYLVRVGKRVLIVGATDSSLTRLGSTSLEAIEAELAAARADRRGPASFRDVLARAMPRGAPAVRPPETPADGD
jgi:flagellar biogenesis protein FliO